MLAYGTKVLAGVTPGKGGQRVDDVPVFDTVSEAIKAFPEINASAVYVPPVTLKDAVLEVLGSGIKTIQVFTEKVPIKDAALLRARAKQEEAMLVGASSVGVISPGLAKLGSVGGGNPQRMFAKGSVGVISKSGGLCSEVAGLLKMAGMGVSTVVGIGGEVIAGSDFVDVGNLFEKDKDTQAVVIVGEVGGSYETLLARAIKDGSLKKPYTAIIGGRFSEMLPSSTRLGHAGAIVEGEEGAYDYKVEILRDAGVLVANQIHELPVLVKKQLNSKTGRKNGR